MRVLRSKRCRCREVTHTPRGAARRCPRGAAPARTPTASLSPPTLPLPFSAPRSGLRPAARRGRVRGGPRGAAPAGEVGGGASALAAMPDKACAARLAKELRALQREPVPGVVVARPADHDVCEWHYLLQGAGGTDYEGGFYHGRVVFPPDYPFRPPAIYMHTPSGRFMSGTRLCLSMSDYHPESWNPLWSVASILQGLMSFMAEVRSGARATARAP